jgi:hypothetical protein
MASIYNANSDIISKLKYGDSLLVKNPNLVYTSLEYREKMFTFPTIKVDDVSNFLLNG